MTYARDMAEEKYPPGTDIYMYESKDPDYPVPSGMKGRVLQVSDTGKVRVLWSNGHSTWIDIVRDHVDAA